MSFVTSKSHIRTLELTKQWDLAIEFMKHVIDKNPDDMDAYISINQLIMNLLIEEDYGDNIVHRESY